MKYYTNSVIVCEVSYGSTGNPLIFKLESGGMVLICTRRCIALDGSEFFNVGFKPNSKWSLSMDDYQNSVDSVMNKALEVLRQKK